MNKEEAIKICENFSIDVYVHHPEFFGSQWKVEQDVRSIMAVKKLLKEYKNLQQELTDYKERNEKAVKLIKENMVECDEYLCCGMMPSKKEELLEILDKKDFNDMTRFFDNATSIERFKDSLDKKDKE